MPGRFDQIARRLFGQEDSVDQQKQIDRLTKLVERVLSNQKQDEKWRMIFRRQLNALIRRDCIADGDLAGPHALAARRFRLRSQNEEDGLVLALLHACGVATRRFVEIGCGRSGGNSAVLAHEFGWGGLMVDASKKAIHQLRFELRANSRVDVVRAHVTPDAFDDLLREHGYTGEVDLLSIDIDSWDYWVLESLTAASPRLLVMEYNALFGPERAVTVPRGPMPDGAPKGYSGASLAALEKLARRKGYRLVICEDAGVNAFFLRDDLAPEIPGLTAAQAYRPILDKYDVHDRRPKNIEIEKLVAERGLPLVEV